MHTSRALEHHGKVHWLAATGGAVMVAGCAAISGLDGYSTGGCSDGCDEGGMPSEGGQPAIADGSADGTTPACETGCSTAVANAQAACVAGGCNSRDGVCTSSGQGCYCTGDAQCVSGKCVSVAGQNDVSCGTGCTGTGAADGFDCLLASPGLPASCAAAAFGYAPTNFAPASYSPPSTATIIDCSPTYNSTTHAFSGWCSGRTQPAIASNVAQSGGPGIDILAFGDLTIDAGNTLTIAGANAVIFAVYGTAAIKGTIHADGTAGAANSSTAGASGAGGDYNCGVSAGGNNDSSAGVSNDGAGGGGASTAGGKGGTACPLGTNTYAGSAGAVRANATIQPLYGGCPGGYGACGCSTAGGGGGGALQISAAGTLTVSGTITANGGAGGSSTCSCSGYAGGSGGGGSGGAILLEGQSVATAGGTIATSGGNGGKDVSGNNSGSGATTSVAGAAGGGSCAAGVDTVGGGGGGGGYGYQKINMGASPIYGCSKGTCNSDHSACLCTDDTECSSGKCVNAHTQCTGSCTGSGAADSADCMSVTSASGACSGSGTADAFHCAP